MTLSYLNPTTINPKAFSYQMADYDAQRNQVLFYPYGSITPPIGNTGVLLAYHANTNNFTSPSSWTAADLSQIVSSNAINFGGGFLDSSDNFAYLPAESHVALQINLAKEYANPKDPTAYASMDLRKIPGIPDAGGFAGVFANGYAYFAPTGDPLKGHVVDGILIRYNSAKSFSTPTSWQWYNMNDITTPPDPALGGEQSMAYVSPYVYLIPFIQQDPSGKSGQIMASKIIRYDTTKDFESASSYQTFDLTTLPFPSAIQAQMKGFTGSVAVGNKLILVPWGLRTTKQTNSVAVMFDTTKQLNDPSAWQYIDLTTVNPEAGGYQFGWLDKNGFVWFVPTSNFNLKPPHSPPFVVWNSALPFNNPSSWTSYANAQNIWSSGVAYDPVTNTAWLSPYGWPSGGALPTLVTQVQEH